MCSSGWPQLVCPHRCAPAHGPQQVCPDRCTLAEFLWAEGWSPPAGLCSHPPAWRPLPLPPPLPGPRPCPPGELTLTPPGPHVPAQGRTKGEEGREKSQRFVLSWADSGASDCQARLAVFNHFISVLGSRGRQPVLSSLLRKTSGRVAQRPLRAPIISCALRSALRSLPGEPVKN